MWIFDGRISRLSNGSVDFRHIHSISSQQLPGFDTSSQFLSFLSVKCPLPTHCQLKAHFIHVKCCKEHFLINKSFHKTLQAPTSPQSWIVGTGFGLSLVCLRCSWPSLLSLPSHCLQATNSEATCHFGSMDTPAHPPVHSLVKR